jgi:hypothetical protein
MAAKEIACTSEAQHQEPKTGELKQKPTKF